MDAFWADESIISNADDHTADPEDVEDLNDLLECLDIPLTIHSPTDLTPSLLIAILESILQQRLDPSVRNATTPTEKIIAMKVFLGVLSDDLLNGVDAEISDIDPRRLARGSWNEVVRVGRVLVQVARRLQISGPFDDEASSSDVHEDHKDEHGPNYKRAAEDSSFEGSEFDLDNIHRRITGISLTHEVSRTNKSDNIVSARPTSALSYDHTRSGASTPVERRRIRTGISQESEPDVMRSTASEDPDSVAATGYPNRTKSHPSTHSGGTHQCSEPPDRSFSDSSQNQQSSRPCRMSLPDSVLDAVNNTSWTAKTSSRKPSSVGSDDAQSETPQQTSYRSSPSNTTILSNREGRSGSPLKHLLHRRQASGPVLVDDIFSPPIPDSEKPGNSELSQSNSTGVSIRYSGWIGRVEGDIEAFEAEKEKLKEKQESQSDSVRSRTRVKSTSRDSTGSLKRDSPSLLDHKLKIHSDGTTRDSPTVRELAASTTSQKRTSPLIRLSPRYPVSSHINPHATRHTSPTQHALALLHERAKMLEELAKLEALRAR